jgi:three-Cys-motif partner protein
MAKDINQDKFPEETKLKLEIFAEYFREWLPVFIHNPFIKGVLIFDFFAGSGKDTDGNMGSPIILLNEAKGKNCEAVKKNKKSIHFTLNEKIENKYNELKNNVELYMSQCATENKCGEECVYQLSFNQKEFKDFLQNEKLTKYLLDSDYAKFVLLDQYGFKQVDEDVFLKFVSFPKTDFIFFISSSFIQRFQEVPATKLYIDTSKIQFSENRPMDCHRFIAKYYKDLIPADKEYYTHHFTIKKRANYWGLIFGTNHSLGMEKFLKVCWTQDPISGESNFNIDNDFPKESLFFDKENTAKKQHISNKIKHKILSGNITDNITGLKFTLKKGCMPKLFTDVVKGLEKEGKIKRIGSTSYSSTNIHKAEPYNIVLMEKI